MINEVYLVGYVGKVGVKTLQNGNKVASVSVATSESWKDKAGDWQQVTEWHNCVFWDKAADGIEERIHKGSLVYVRGKIKTRKWQDKEGVDRYTAEIQCDKLRVIKKDSSNTASSAPEAQKEEPQREHGDDLPF